MVHVPARLLGFDLCHRPHDGPSVDKEWTLHILRLRGHAPADPSRPHYRDRAKSNARWMKQICRNLADTEGGLLKNASHLVVDRDTNFIAERYYLEQDADTEVILLPKSLNLNAYMERWFRSLKSEWLDRMIFFGRKSLKNAVREYVEHSHAERNHQGLGNELIEPVDDADSVAGRIECRKRLGAMLKYYHRRAASGLVTAHSNLAFLRC